MTNEKLPKGTVIGHKPCVGCTSNQPLKITKSGHDVCQICGMCSGRLFYGREPSQRLIARFLGSKTVKKQAPEPKQTDDDGGEYWYGG